MLTEPVLRALTRIAAVVCIGLGLVGLFLPVLPTTPFLILATVLSFRSSPKLRYWLLKHPVFGSTIRNFLRNREISATALKSALTGLWLGLIVSVLLIQKIWVTVSLAIIGLGVTVYLLRLNRLDPPE